MLSSMTGFATQQTDINDLLIIWETKSVNHRYQEITIRLPEAYRSLEGAFRSHVKSKISRGKVDIQLKLQEKQRNKDHFLINKERVKTIVDEVNKAGEYVKNLGSLSWDTLLTLPDILLKIEKDSLSEDILLKSLQEAVQRLCNSRKQEGQYLQSIISDRHSKLEEITKSISDKIAYLNNQIKVKLETRLADLSISIEKDRIIQEVGILLTKMDVAEEIDRIKVHSQQIKLALNLKEPVGRRLDFLMQELNREVNTLGVKIEDVQVRKQVVEMKVIIEQIREQIQNIE